MRAFCKLALKCVLVLLPIWACILYTRFNLISVLSADSMGAMWNTAFTNTQQQKYYKTIILGDSTANGIYIPEILSDDTINLGLAGTSVVENYYTLENYLTHNMAPEHVFISIADYHLAQEAITWILSNNVHKLNLKQNIEIYHNIKEYSHESLIDVIGCNKYWSELLQYQLYMPQKYIFSIMASTNDNRAIQNRNTINMISARLGRHCCISNEIYEPEGEEGNQEFKVCDLQNEYYKKLVELCANYNISLHVVKLPSPSNVYYFDSYVDQIDEYYASLLKGHDNTEFLWPSARYDIYYFSDATHLNNHGSLVFSREIKRLCPDAFENNTISVNRSHALDEDLRGENDANFINAWISDFDYTVDTYKENAVTYIKITNNTNDELISTKTLFLNESGVYEMKEVEN